MSYSKSLLFVFLFVSIVGSVFAQTTKDLEPKKQGTAIRDGKRPNLGSNSAYKGSHYEEHHRRTTWEKLFKKKPTSLEEEYEVRMKKVAKKKREEAREMEKPQYSNPLYFGHKKPPKKRPIGKRKFCDECGIVH